MILKVMDIIHLKDIEADSLVYFKIVEYKENPKLEHLLTSDVK